MTSSVSPDPISPKFLPQVGRKSTLHFKNRHEATLRAALRPFAFRRPRRSLRAAAASFPSYRGPPGDGACCRTASPLSCVTKDSDLLAS